MMKKLLLTGVLLALTASLVSAAGLNLRWTNPLDAGLNTCPSSVQALTNVTNACISNSGATFLMIGSVVSPGSLPNVVGQAVVVIYQESGVTALSDWWKFADGDCRGFQNPTSASASINVAFDPGNDEGACSNLWQLSSSGASAFQDNVDYNQNPSTEGRGRISGAFATASGQPWPAGTEWYSFRLSIDKRHTVAGTLPVCAGCLDGVCFGFNFANINQPAGTPGGDATLGDAASAGSNFVSYNGGGTLTCSSAVPVRRATWGQVKSLYR